MIWLPKRKRFVAFLPKGVLGKDGHPIAQFDDAETAALFRDRVLLHHAGLRDPRLNFPARKLKPMTIEAARRAARLSWKNSRHTNSRYRGVNKARQKGFWTAALWDGDGASHFLGTWATEKAAAQAYDRGARYYGLPAEYLNFPRQSLPAASGEQLANEAFQITKARRLSRFLGVTRNNRRNKWVAKIAWRDQGRMVHRTIGYFDDEEDAAHARDKAARERHGKYTKLNFHPDTGKPIFGLRLIPPGKTQK